MSASSRCKRSWFDRPDVYGNVFLASNGRSVAADTTDMGSQNVVDIWTYELRCESTAGQYRGNLRCLGVDRKSLSGALNENLFKWGEQGGIGYTSWRC